MKILGNFLYAVMAGVSIGLGGAVYLATDSKIAGAIFFTVGLFTVVTFGFHLFTGKVAYLFDHSPRYLLFLANVWLGNLVGAMAVGYSLRATRAAVLAEKASTLCQIKLNDTLWSIFLLAIFCNLLIFIAVDGFSHNPHEIGRYIGLFLGVVVFILCGFEHCVANMFYFSMANAWSGHTLLYLLVMTLGNSVGGLIIPLVRKCGAAAFKNEQKEQTPCNS